MSSTVTKIVIQGLYKIARNTKKGLRQSQKIDRKPLIYLWYPEGA